MQATGAPGGIVRLERARALGRELHEALPDVPTGVATLTNRMMPLLFPTGDERGVTAVIDHSLRLMQPQPAALTAARASSLGALTLAADRSYYNPSARKRALVVFSDLDSDFFSLEGTLRLLRQQPDRAVPRPRRCSGRADLRRCRPTERVRLGQHGVGGRAPPCALARVRGGRERTPRVRDPHVSRPGPGRRKRTRRVAAGPRAVVCARSPGARGRARVPCPPRRFPDTHLQRERGLGRLAPGETARRRRLGPPGSTRSCAARPASRTRAARARRQDTGHRSGVGDYAFSIARPFQEARGRAPSGSPEGRRRRSQEGVGDTHLPHRRRRLSRGPRAGPFRIARRAQKKSQEGVGDTLFHRRLPHVTRQPPGGVERVCTR